jgi:hypothetical protein
MSTGPDQHRAIPNAVVPATPPLPWWSRSLAVATAAIFCISTAFPVLAGLSKNPGAFPKWWGKADVVLAFLLAAMVFAVMVAAHGKVSRQIDDATYRAYRVLIHGLFITLVVFFLAGDRITWSNCLTGLSWRAWLLLYALPAWIAALRTVSSE